MCWHRRHRMPEASQRLEAGNGRSGGPRVVWGAGGVKDRESTSGHATGLGALLALCSALLQKSLRGGLIVAGQLNLGGSIDPIHDAVNAAELAVEKGATTLLVPISARRQLMDLSDDMAAKLSIQFYVDGRDALLKGMLE